MAIIKDMRLNHRVSHRAGGLGVRVLLVEEDTPSRAGLEYLLDGQGWVSLCAVADGRDAAVDATRRYRPDVAVVAIDPFIAATVAAIRGANRGTEIVLAAQCHGSGEVFTRRLRARAYLPPTATTDEVVDTVWRVTSQLGPVSDACPVPGGHPEGLSPRELQVLTLMSTGATNREIAQELHLGPDSIKRYATSIYRKLGVRNRTEATRQIVGTTLAV